MNRLNRSLVVAMAVLVGLAITVPYAYAGPTLYQTGFENHPFVAGQPLVGYGGWIGVDARPNGPNLNPFAAVISTDKSQQGRQSVLVPGKNLAHDDIVNQATGGYYDAIGSYRKPVNPPDGYDTRGTQTVRVSAYVRMDGPQTPGDNFFSASISAVAQGYEDGDFAPEGVGELAISSDGQVHAYTGADFKPNILISAPVSLGEWHSLAVEANFATKETSFFLDDKFLGAIPFDSRVTDPHVTQHTLLRGSMVTYAAPDTSSNQKANYSAHFDQFLIKVLGPNGPKN